MHRRLVLALIHLRGGIVPMDLMLTAKVQTDRVGPDENESACSFAICDNGHGAKLGDEGKREHLRGKAVKTGQGTLLATKQVALS